MREAQADLGEGGIAGRHQTMPCVPLAEPVICLGVKYTGSREYYQIPEKHRTS